ncbi:hypothetical protein FRB98_006881 [Tulasnella sp. 332]|nr:hypothetical protein FRB98_006881 [Tulasnella sp. 332]
MSESQSILKLYGTDRSTCCQRVKVVAYEKELDLSLEAVDMMGKEHKQDAYLAKQPFGQIPYLDDNGFTLFQSRAICRYIAMKYPNQGTKLLPDASDIKAVSIFEQAINIEQADFDPNASGLTMQKLFLPMRGGKTDEEQLKKHVDGLRMKLDGFERILSKQKYLSGDEISLADLFALPYGTKVEICYPDFFHDSSRPNVRRWWDAISNRQSWKRVLVEAE